MKIRNLKNNRTFLTILQGFLLLVILSSLFSMSVSLALYPIAGSGNLTDEIVGIAVQQEKMRFSESGSASGDPDAAAPVMPERASAVQENVDQLPGDLADLAKNVGPFQPFAVCMYVSLSVLFMLFTFIGRKPGKLPVLRYRIGSLCFAVCAVVCLLENSENLCWLITILHGFALITDHVLSIVMNHKVRNVVFRVLSVFFVVLLLIINFVSGRTALFCLALISVPRIFYYIARIAFSQVKLDILKKIMQKTYAAEILFGMLLLIIAFSIVLPQFETGIPTFEDALWYCFAIVTTIGFGDFTTVTLPGRIISVILGCYGIVMVALITSIIINFYSETKDSEDSETKSEAVLPDRERSPEKPV